MTVRSPFLNPLALKGAFRSPIVGGTKGEEFRKRTELQARQRLSEKERKRIAQSSERSARDRANAMMEAAGYSQEAAKRMEAEQRANLERTQERTQAATEQAQGYLNPWREAGTDALGKLQEKIDSGPGDFKKSPGYEFRLAEGQKAVERSASARGGALGGAAVKAGLRYGQNFATNDYDNFLRRYYESMEPLERMSGQGMSAADRMGGIGMQGARDQADQGFKGTDRIGSAQQYGAESMGRGTRESADIIDTQKQAAAERDYGYAAWKAGEDF